MELFMLNRSSALLSFTNPKVQPFYNLREADELMLEIHTEQIVKHCVWDKSLKLLVQFAEPLSHFMLSS